MRPLIVLTAQLADLAAFAVAVPVTGIGGEANPLMTGLWAQAGLGGVIAFKTGGALLLAAIVPRLGRWWLLPALAGIAGAITAIVALWAS